MTTITEEQFLESFRKVCQDFVETYKKQEDPDSPTHLFWSRDFAMDRVKEMPEEYYDMGKRAQYGQEGDGYDLFQPMNKIIRECEQDLRAWFATAGYDDAHIPTAPEMDHTRIKMKAEGLADWKEKSKKNDVKTAYRIGQLVYIGSSSTSHGWAELYLLTGERLCQFHPTYSGVYVWNKEATELVWKTAEAYSKLTDWSAFTATAPKKVRRSIQKRMHAIIDENGLREYARLG